MADVVQFFAFLMMLLSMVMGLGVVVVLVVVVVVVVVDGRGCDSGVAGQRNTSTSSGTSPSLPLAILNCVPDGLVLPSTLVSCWRGWSWLQWSRCPL